MVKSFGNEEYFKKVFGKQERDIDKSSYKKIKTAFKLAHDVRKFEIALFWKRGTYFWAFILGSFTAYFVALDKMIGKKSVSLQTFVELPVLSKIILLIISCTTLIFCLSWVLINKGSKFWQNNWESHIDIMEDMFSGKLYKTILNTENENFKRTPFRKEVYDYSVTKVTTVGSIVLMCIAGIICFFHFVLFIGNSMYKLYQKVQGCKNIIGCCIAIFIVVLVGIACSKLLKCLGNSDTNKSQEKWRQR